MPDWVLAISATAGLKSFIPPAAPNANMSSAWAIHSTTFRPLLGFVVELGMGSSAPPRFDAKMTPMVAQEVAVAPRRSHDAQNIDAVARKKTLSPRRAGPLSRSDSHTPRTSSPKATTPLPGKPKPSPANPSRPRQTQAVPGKPKPSPANPSRP